MKTQGCSPRRRAMRSPTARAPTAPNAAAMPTELPTTPVVMPAAAPPTPTPVMTVPATAASAGAARPPACKLFSEETLAESSCRHCPPTCGQQLIGPLCAPESIGRVQDDEAMS